ncbi:hypothetical protein [Brachybacterium fresconis]|uniref:Uncharacterized protein n=1 Tax=Brachybacterium fresconis TaxID=173363 RepID=A0ABS4YJG9_9MICO|nr:hypothetical protein [Brachybacterium fresconis]MBP2408937.1 hypothetical protein [Brachybacterium fresconis]
MNGQDRAGTAQPPAGAELLVRGDTVWARELVEEFFVDRGWRVRDRGPGRVDYEWGSRRRTLLLGALAGRRFHVTARIALRPGRGSMLRGGAGPDGDAGTDDGTVTDDDTVTDDGTGTDDDTETTSVLYGGDAADGRALGGTLGRARAARVHRETRSALEQHLAAGGHLVRGRRR